MLKVHASTVYIRWMYFLVRTTQAQLILVEPNHPQLGGLSKATSQAPAQRYFNPIERRIYICDGIWRGERIIGKVEKDFELVTNPRNLRLYIKGDTLHNHITHYDFNTLVCESYYGCQELGFLTLTIESMEGLRISYSSHQGSKRFDLRTQPSLQPWETQRLV